MKQFGAVCVWLGLMAGWASGALTIQVPRHDILPAKTLPQSMPWNLAWLSKPPVFTWAEGEEVRSLYYGGEPYQGKPTRVFAYYATPGTLAGDRSLDKNLPAVVLVHGGGGTAFSKWAKLWAQRGYAAIAMDLTGRGPDKKRLEDGGPGQSHALIFDTIALPNTEQWSYHAVANVIRAHSLIRAFPEIDADRTGLTGISWGGYLTCIVAGLDNRFKAAVPVYGCGYLHENSVWIKDFTKMSFDHWNKWIELWDPSRYVGSAAMPMLFVNGGTDFAYPPDSYARTYDLVQSPKNIRFVPHLPHGHIFDRPKAVEVFMNHYLKEEGAPLARVGELVVEEGRVSAKVEAQTSLVKAGLHYTLDDLPGNNRTRKWLKQEATVDAGTITAALPPKDARVWFLTVTDERGTLVSSPLQLNPKEKPTILCVGDSITQGGRSYPCYRQPLVEALKQRGTPYRFIGPLRDASSAHAGYGGRSTAYLRELLVTLYPEYPADIVLLHSGHNSFSKDKPVPGILKDTEAIIRNMRKTNPGVTVLLAQVIPSGKLPKYDYIPDLNQGLKMLAERLSMEEGRVVAVDHAQGFDWKKDTKEDKVHPNASGARKMSDVWLNVLLSL